MHISVAFIMLVTLSCTALNAAADKKPVAQEIFALYDPSCSSCSKSVIGMRGGIDEKNKQLTLTLTQDDQPISDTVKLWGNELYLQPIDGTLPRRFKWNGEPIKLSIAARIQYKGVIPDKSNPKKGIYLHIEDAAFKGVYFCGKFLIIENGQDDRALVRSELSSVTAVIESLKSVASHPRRFSQPFIVVDTNEYLTYCFGSDWVHKLPVYRHPTTKEVMTKAEYDAKYYPKALTDKKSC